MPDIVVLPKVLPVVSIIHTFAEVGNDRVQKAVDGTLEIGSGRRRDAIHFPERVPVSVVMLAYNEVQTIENEVATVFSQIIEQLPGSELIVAEDGSQDGTTEVLQGLSKNLNIVHIHRKERRGYTRAFEDAVLLARHELVFFADTGFKFDYRNFWRLYDAVFGYDIVVGLRTKRRDQQYRKLFTYLFNWYISRYFGVTGVSDADSGFRLFRRTVVDRVIRPGLTFKGFVGAEIVLRSLAAGLRYREVPVDYFPRRGRSRGLPPRRVPRAVLRVIKDLNRLKKGIGAPDADT